MQEGPISNNLFLAYCQKVSVYKYMKVSPLHVTHDEQTSPRWLCSFLLCRSHSHPLLAKSFEGKTRIVDEYASSLTQRVSLDLNVAIFGACFDISISPHSQLKTKCYITRTHKLGGKYKHLYSHISYTVSMHIWPVFFLLAAKIATLNESHEIVLLYYENNEKSECGNMCSTCCTTSTVYESGAQTRPQRLMGIHSSFMARTVLDCCLLKNGGQKHRAFPLIKASVKIIFLTAAEMYKQQTTPRP